MAFGLIPMHAALLCQYGEYWADYSQTGTIAGHSTTMFMLEFVLSSAVKVACGICCTHGIVGEVCGINLLLSETD